MLALASFAFSGGPTASRPAVAQRAASPVAISRREVAGSFVSGAILLGATKANAKPEDYAGGYTTKMAEERLKLPTDGKNKIEPLIKPKAPPSPPPAEKPAEEAK